MTAAASPAIDLAHLRSWIGRTEDAADTVTPELVRRFEATLDRAAERLATGEAAPLGIHLCLAPAAVPAAELGRDGHPRRGGLLPPVPLPRRMWAGGEFAFFRPLAVGDTVHRTTRIGDVTVKEGRTGTLCFVTVEHVLDVAGEVAIRERQDIVYRDAGAASGAAPAAGAGTWRLTVEPDPVLLFRYSALTFNGHRIHYDRRYCIEEESYPGLVVHGPLQATLLLRFAAELRDRRAPARFSFRSLAPLFDGGPFTLRAEADGDRMALWTANERGELAMRAEAQW